MDVINVPDSHICQSPPIPCGAGLWTSSSGGSSGADCVECWEGFYCTAEGDRRACGATQWSDAGSSAPEDCYDCPAGYYCDDQGTKQACDVLVNGHRYW